MRPTLWGAPCSFTMGSGLWHGVNSIPGPFWGRSTRFMGRTSAGGRKQNWVGLPKKINRHLLTCFAPITVPMIARQEVLVQSKYTPGWSQRSPSPSTVSSQIQGCLDQSNILSLYLCKEKPGGWSLVFLWFLDKGRLGSLAWSPRGAKFKSADTTRPIEVLGRLGWWWWWLGGFCWRGNQSLPRADSLYGVHNILHIWLVQDCYLHI